MEKPEKLGKLERIAGEVITDEDVLEKYGRDYSLTPPQKPIGVVKVESYEQVGDLIEWANETLTPLIPTSSGFPKFHGDTIPESGGIIVDLSGLREILLVDATNRLAVIEPGVTFEQLKMELEKHGLVPHLPLLPRVTKSVVASYLEREPVLVPKDHWDWQDPLLAVEVVFGTGDVFKTGGLTLLSREEIREKVVSPIAPMGPLNIDVQKIIQGAQGTIGIVTLASVKCRFKPSVQRPFFAISDRLDALIQFMYAVLRRRMVEEMFLANGFAFANIIEEGERIAEIASNLPRWMVFVNLAGYEKYPDEKVAYKEEQVRELASRFGIEMRSEVDGVSAYSLLRKLDVAEKDRRIRYKTSCQDIPFTTMLEKIPVLTETIEKVAAKHGYNPAEIAIYAQPVVQGIQCACEFDLMYNLDDVAERRIVERTYGIAAKELMKCGAYYSRPYGMLAEVLYEREGYLVNVLRKAKEIFDPNWILNPGKLCF